MDLEYSAHSNQETGVKTHFLILSTTLHVIQLKRLDNHFVTIETTVQMCIYGCDK